MKGISPIVAVVLLIAIAVVASVGLYFWTAGLATKQTTINSPVAITANPVGDGQILIANMGSNDLVTSSLHTTDSGLELDCPDSISVGEQAMCTVTGSTNASDFAIYGTSASAVRIQVASVFGPDGVSAVSFEYSPGGTNSFEQTNFGGGSFTNSSNGSVQLHPSYVPNGLVNATDLVTPGSDNTSAVFSLVVDSLNHPHVIWEEYTDSLNNHQVMYAYWNGVEWTGLENPTFDVVSSDTLPPAHVTYGALVVDSNNNPHIVFEVYDGFSAKDIAYRYWNGVAWTGNVNSTDIIAGVEFSGRSPTMDVDSNDFPHIVWQSGEDMFGAGSSDQDVFYTHWNGTHWTAYINSTDVITGGSPIFDSGQPTIVVDKTTDTPHVIWIEQLEGGLSSDYFYSRWNGTGWSGYTGPFDNLTASIDFSHIIFNEGAFVLDSNSYPHVAIPVMTMGGPLVIDVRYIHWNGTDWFGMVNETDVLTYDGWSSRPSLVLDSNEYPHLTTSHNPVHIYWTGSEWDYDDFLSCIIDPDLTTAYIDMGTGDVLHAVWSAEEGSGNSGPEDFDVYYVRGELGNYYSSGSFVSEAFELDENSLMTSVSWDETTPANTGISMEIVFSNNTDWSTNITQSVSNGDNIVGTVGGYIKYKATFTTTDTTETPVLDSISLESAAEATLTYEVNLVELEWVAMSQDCGDGLELIVNETTIGLYTNTVAVTPGCDYTVWGPAFDPMTYTDGETVLVEKELVCADDDDNDEDNYTDCNDPDCGDDAACLPWLDWNVTWDNGGDELFRNVDLHSNGYLYVSGVTHETFGNAAADWVIIKYDTDGNVDDSSIIDITGDYDLPFDSRVSPDGYIYVVGMAGFMGADITVKKFDVDLVEQWTFTADGSNDMGGLGIDVGTDVAFDDNYVYVSSTNNVLSTVDHVLLFKLDKLTGNQIWNVTWDAPMAEAADGIVLDNDGNIFIIGSTNSFGNGIEVALIKFNSSGSQLWNVTFGTPDDDSSRDLKIINDYIYVAYRQHEDVDCGDPGIVKFDMDGNQIWNTTFDDSWCGSFDYLESDAEGNIFISGITEDWGSGKSTDLNVVKYRPDGVQLWNVSWGGALPELGGGLHTTNDAIYLVGRTASYGVDVQDAVLLKYVIP